MSNLTHIALHHFGGVKNDRHASTKNFTLEQISNAHRDRWPNFPSLLSLPDGKQNFIGYSFVIRPDGTYFQSRPLGAETAAQRYWNENTVSICCAGNHLVEQPTREQISTVRNLMLTLLEGRPDKMNLKVVQGTVFDLHLSRIFPHRYFQPDTECNCLPDSWGRDIITGYYQEQIGTLTKLVQDLILKIKVLLEKRKLGKIKVGSIDTRNYQCNL